ncbi:hypothetical protein HYFRA_00002019 [Hymenoscyphus fraxineus]|uniref:Uncharacterized protein n=1 Tax=Hymenoscyphus fraxineus TaxID=746836 RepID=A0A9N9KKG6_9HELO|nr:hypothetical protein HYFRA_00002019 [Hymenoscyphus fraxineus]
MTCGMWAPMHDLAALQGCIATPMQWVFGTGSTFGHWMLQVPASRQEKGMIKLLDDGGSERVRLIEFS